jgi:hypothetical protein
MSKTVARRPRKLRHRTRPTPLIPRRDFLMEYIASDEGERVAADLDANRTLRAWAFVHPHDLNDRIYTGGRAS